MKPLPGRIGSCSDGERGKVDRREFLRLLAIAGIATGSAGCAARKQLPEADIYAAERA